MAARVNTPTVHTFGADPSGSIAVGAGSARVHLLPEIWSTTAVPSFTIRKGGAAKDGTFAFEAGSGSARVLILLHYWLEATLAGRDGDALTYNDGLDPHPVASVAAEFTLQDRDQNPGNWQTAQGATTSGAAVAAGPLTAAVNDYLLALNAHKTSNRSFTWSSSPTGVSELYDADITGGLNASFAEQDVTSAAAHTITATKNTADTQQSLTALLLIPSVGGSTSLQSISGDDVVPFGETADVVGTQLSAVDTVTVDGTAQTLNSNIADVLSVTFDDIGAARFGVDVELEVLDSTGPTGLGTRTMQWATQAGWQYVNLGALAASQHRIKATPDLAPGDQIWWGNVSAGSVTVFPDGHAEGTALPVTFDFFVNDSVWGASGTVTIQAPGAAPVFVGPDIGDATYPVNSAITPVDYSALFTGETGFALGGGTPAGLSLSGAGVLSGTPTADGVHAGITIIASNASGSTPSNEFTITITPGPPQFDGPDIAALAYDFGEAITPVDFSGLFSHPGSLTLTFDVVGTLPGGLSLSSAGVLSGTTAGAGEFTAEVRATDTNGATATSNEFLITVTSDTAAPELVRYVPSMVLLRARPVSIDYSTYFSSPGGLPMTYEVVTTGFTLQEGYTAGLPPGLSLDTNTGVVSGTQTTLGNFAFVIRATDSAGRSVDSNVI